jgi:DNA-binding PadR family transcriptional regulator
MTLKHTILGVLDWVPLHGYALREMTRGYAWIQPMAHVNLYPTLRELEKDGFVEHVEEVHEGRLRKIYSVTEAGRAELHRWLADPEHGAGAYRDPALLKLCLLRRGALGGAEPWITSELARNAQVLEEAERWLAENAERIPKYSRRVAEFGREVQRLRVQWLRQVLEEVRSDARSERRAG